MKKIIICSLFTSFVFISCVGFNGCKSDKIQVIHNDKVVTNSVPMKAFNDESYVWENWIIGTNQVKNIDR